MELHVEYFQVFFLFSQCLVSLTRMCVGLQTQWMVAPQTATEMESAWQDTAIALLDSWVLTVPKVRNTGWYYSIVFLFPTITM